MALTGLEIYKQLPKTNCKDCGVPTCLAFAMKVASGQAALTACPHLSGERGRGWTRLRRLPSDWSGSAIPVTSKSARRRSSSGTRRSFTARPRWR